MWTADKEMIKEEILKYILHNPKVNINRHILEQEGEPSIGVYIPSDRAGAQSSASVPVPTPDRVELQPSAPIPVPTPALRGSKRKRGSKSEDNNHIHKIKPTLKY